MLAYVSLAVVWLSAMFAVWSRKDQDKRISLISSLIATAGLVVGVALAYTNAESSEKKSALEKQRYESGLRTAVAQTAPVDLSVEWIFEKPPAELASLFDVWPMYEHSAYMRDDDFGRAPQSVKQNLLADDYLTQIMSPLTRLIVTPGGGVLSDFPAETKADLATWKSLNNGGPGDISDFMPDAYYRGPQFEILMPVGANGNAVISLGDPADDPVFSEEELPPGNNVYSDAKNFAFDAGATMDEKLTLAWRYSGDSLPRAIALDGQSAARSSLPPAFNLVIVHDDITKADYLSKAAKLTLQSAAAPAKAPSASDWTASSRLVVTFNGLSEARYVFRVTRAGAGEYKTDMGAYDEPAKEFEYTLFHCVLEEDPDS